MPGYHTPGWVTGGKCGLRSLDLPAMLRESPGHSEGQRDVPSPPGPRPSGNQAGEQGTQPHRPLQRC